MASRILEFFGYAPQDRSPIASATRSQLLCPFLDDICCKKLRDGSISGVCSLITPKAKKVIVCPIRLYSDRYQVLADVAKIAFRQEVSLHPGRNAKQAPVIPGTARVAVFGKGWGKELRLPRRGGSGAFFVDWVLVKLDDLGNFEEFVAVEVQAIDTTGNYQNERTAHLNNIDFSGQSTAGFNWENVNKRILPQIIYKGHVLRREKLCRSGLFFICPTPVYEKIRERLGGALLDYNFQPGALTFMWYDLGLEVPDGQIRPLVIGGRITTTIDQVALAFTSPSNLPPQNVYETAIRSELGER